MIDVKYKNNYANNYKIDCLVSNNLYKKNALNRSEGLETIQRLLRQGSKRGNIIAPSLLKINIFAYLSSIKSFHKKNTSFDTHSLMVVYD
jgi:hypothetical protein